MSDAGLAPINERPSQAPSAVIDAYLSRIRPWVSAEIDRYVPADRRDTGGLYALVRDYPARAAKMLRPALAIAAARSLGAPLDAVLPTAAALELYHNAFLVHDDIEDGSELRRGLPTLHRREGLSIAVNVGDGMLALAMEPLLANVRHVGLAAALAVLREIVTMAQVSAEGQAMELAWIRDNAVELSGADYLRLVLKKTARYSFVTPVRCGAMVAGAPASQLAAFSRFAARLGVAFQIQDDVLNLTATDTTETRYGKEQAGDLWEGKRTLILIEALRRATGAERAQATRILALPRDRRNEAHIEQLGSLIEAYGAIEHARSVAIGHADRARAILARLPLPDTADRAFLSGLVGYVTERTW